MLTLDGITLRLGGHLILNRACAALPPKSRVGLVSGNGAGKSSLLKLIAGIYEADDGAIEAPSGMRIGVAQEAPGGEGTPFETVLAAAAERSRCFSPSLTCCCSTSRRTTSISKRRYGSNSFKSYRASLIVVSHERDLLNRITDHVLHLNRVALYPGDYDALVKQWRQRDAQTEVTRAAQDFAS
jgi:ATPase subunit of ABC transporter with duplicated ATPase domains